MKSVLAALILITLAPAAHARDLYHFHNLGFSRDGKYFAFGESVENDGSGFHSANVAVVDVAANKVVSGKRVTLERDGATEEQALARAIAGANPGAYGIATNAPRGEDLLVRELTDRSTYSDTVFTTYWYRTYQLLVEKTAVPVDRSCLVNGGELLKLTLKSAEAGNDLVKVLQDDQSLPPVRLCANSYSVARVTRFNDSLVVMVSYHVDGFEGGDIHFMAVTAKVKLD